MTGLRAASILVTLQLTGPGALSGQERTTVRPTLQAGAVEQGLRLDGRLDEPMWARAARIDGLVMTEPVEGGAPTCSTMVWVLADRAGLVIGVRAADPNPAGITAYAIARDADLDDDDHVLIVIDPFLDGRSGYVFAVNPRGARLDALVTARGEETDERWDGIWEAAVHRGAFGWSVEIRIPAQSISFTPGLTEWGFNVQRRVARLQEVSRWASPSRDIDVAQTSRAGLLTGLPPFSAGVGITLRPATTAGIGLDGGPVDSVRETFHPSLDLFQRLGPVTVIASANTDFAETEVDARRTNLTRFPLFFEEKRAFFLEGSDIFDFGVGMGTFSGPDVLPFHSRRIGLYQGEQVPVWAGGKVNGRVGGTSVGALVTRTGRNVDVGIEPATMGAVRVRQNLFAESSGGVIATVGDPAGRRGSYTAGGDFTFQTSRLGGDRNLVAGGWAMVTGRDDLTGDRTAFGGQIALPNDVWNANITYKRIGGGFDPSLSFVPRRSVQLASAELEYTIRPGWSWLRTMRHEFRPSVALDLEGRWESYRIFTAPLNWRLESGDRFEFNVNPQGERLTEPFEIADGVVIPAGDYRFARLRLEGEFAAKRMLSGQVTWWFGTFYDGQLDELELEIELQPVPLLTIEVNLERNMGRLPAGNFTTQQYQGRLQLNASPNLTVASLVQYDTESRALGSNTRLRWTYSPNGDLFVVYNLNTANRLAPRRGWELDTTELLVKLQYAFRW
jgi:Domain of unknown function (DUF5916)